MLQTAYTGYITAHTRYRQTTHGTDRPHPKSLLCVAHHEEHTKKKHHAQGICEHHVACQCGCEPVQGETKLVGQEHDGPEHEEPAASNPLV